MPPLADKLSAPGGLFEARFGRSFGRLPGGSSGRLAGLLPGAAKWASERSPVPGEEARHGGDVEIGPIGFELGERELHLLQLQRSGGELRIRAASSCAYPCARDELCAAPRRLRRFVAGALAAQPFSGRCVVACTPVHSLRLIMLEYTLDPGEDEPALILRQTLERIGGSPADWVIDYLPLRRRVREERKRAALVAVVPHAAQVAHLELLRRAGLRVQALEIGPLAIRRLVVASGAAERGEYHNVLVINIGPDKGYLTVISGRRLLLDREIAFGEAQLLARLGAALQMDEGEGRRALRDFGFAAPGDADCRSAGGATAGEIVAALTEITRPALHELRREVDKVLLYLAAQLHGAGVDSVYLLGCAAHWPGACELFGGLLQRPVTLLDPFAGFAAGAGAAPVDGHPASTGMALAAGCALRGLLPDD